MTLAFLPNEADATFENQAEPDSVDFEILLLGHRETGVVSGCEVTESDPVALTVDVAFGEAVLDGALVAVSTQADIAVATPNGANPRFDLVTISSNGTAVVTTGTAAENPALPPIPADSVPIAGVYVPSGNTQLTLETKTVDSDASSVTFDLPPGVATGDSIVLLVSNTSDRSIDTFNAGDTNWTVISHLIEPPCKVDIATRVLTSGDSKTEVTANTSGTGDIHCWAYKAEGTDVTSAGVVTNDLGSTFHQYMVDNDSGDTDGKLWVCLSAKNQTGLIEQSFSLDYSDLNVHDETQTSPPQSVIISAYASTDQEMFRLDTDGPPHWPYYLKSTNEQMASITAFFDATGGTGDVVDNTINDKRVFLRHVVPHAILDKEIPLPQRERLNFIDGVTATDVLTGEEDYGDAALTLSPYLHWVMDDTSGDLDDTSSNGRDGTSVGNPTYEVAESGVEASPVSILFDGTDDSFTRPYDATLEEDVTVIVWYKGTDTNCGLFSCGDSSANKAWDAIIDVSGFVQVRNKPSYGPSDSTTSVDDDVWHMIAITAPGSGTLRVFQDGVETGSVAFDESAQGSPAFKLGLVRTLDKVIGHLNFCTIYTSVFTEAAILALYNARDIVGGERWTTVAVDPDTRLGAVYSRPSGETVHVDDDEFDGTDKAGWTELVVSGTATWTEGQGLMSVAFEDQSPEDFVVLGKAITTATLPITIETWISGWLANDLGLSHIGTFFSDGLTATDSQVTSVVSFGADPGLNINNGTFTAHTGVAGGYNFQESGLMNGLGMRLIWTAANTWKALYSIDGVTWVDLEGGQSITMTPTSFGLMVSSWDADSKISLASFEYFRVTDSDLS